MCIRPWILWVCFLAFVPEASARTVYKCWRAGTASVSTQPEPGSRCTPHHFPDGPKPANVWEEMGLHQGTLYSVEKDNQVFYTTRSLPGAKTVFNFTVRQVPDKMKEAVPGPTARPIAVGRPRMGVFDGLFRAAAARYRIDEAYLRAVAHVESGYSPRAVSPKGAMGVMQLMPATASMYGVSDPFHASQSINAGARHLAYLLRLYSGDRKLAAAAYNAGVGAVRQYNGVPPYAETRAYVQRVDAMYWAYRKVLQ